MTMLRILKRNEEGAAAIEMAIALPVLVAMIYGLFQVGLLYQANAGMQHALGEGARYATLCITSGSTCTAPTDTQIKTRISSKLFGRGDGTFTVNDPVPGTGYRDLSVRYSKRMNFLFFSGPTITLNRSKRAYVVV
ncbi:MAG TPA: TadE/TadG family type IV pilus assembly protein [Sphingomicrobium sp.]|nr:TadE/TadG family type IV pilus assembly protein [Sphingomicrobium sp.]